MLDVTLVQIVTIDGLGPRTLELIDENVDVAVAPGDWREDSTLTTAA